MSTPFHLRCPGACARVEARDGVFHLRPDTPPAVAGNHWFRFLVGVDASDAPIPFVLHWPASGGQEGGEYAGNHNFATVLDRCCFLDPGTGTWERVASLRETGGGVEGTIPPGGDGRRFAVGMPVTAVDLHRVLERVQGHPEGVVRRIGFGQRGSPIWRASLGGGEAAGGTILLQAMQHGSEWAGLRVMEGLVEYLLSDAGAMMRRRWRWCLYPATNADSLYQGWRGDMMEVEGVNPNRDWGVFALPETRAVAEDIHRTLREGAPLRQVIDLHMGWNWRKDPGSGIGIPAAETDDTLPARVRTRMHAFADILLEGSSFTRFRWSVHGGDRPTFPSWLYRETGVHGHTLEVSRHLWPTPDGGVTTPEPAFEKRLGKDLVCALDRFLLKEQVQ